MSDDVSFSVSAALGMVTAEAGILAKTAYCPFSCGVVAQEMQWQADVVVGW